MDYRKLNKATRKDHFPLPFIDQMLDRLAGHEFYCLLDGYSGYNQIAISPEDQEKTTFTCPYGTFAFRRVPFGLCGAPATFQRCMMAIFSEMIGINVEVFMDDFSKFLHDVKWYIWDEPFLFKQGVDQILRRCIPNNEVEGVLRECHSTGYGGHYSGEKTAKRVLQAVFTGQLCLKMLINLCWVAIDVNVQVIYLGGMKCLLKCFWKSK
ncbi:hypothetical protein DCAR_0519945 [Daucus carota subsp. sativus]|uniref:Reverse transcriptase domain-containing protein n=1 Tax=Daucus carota subsp. sativus TaxID=79200 RepID=A0AAF0X5B3_DAUCS|nr:hypothetical protein DCAR_0519945 [Daucus carota subsp. sativus]